MIIFNLFGYRAVKPATNLIAVTDYIQMNDS